MNVVQDAIPDLVWLSATPVSEAVGEDGVTSCWWD